MLNSSSMEEENQGDTPKPAAEPPHQVDITHTSAPTSGETVVKIDDSSARYWEILQHNVEWLRFSETKAGLIITVYGVVFTIAYSNSVAILSSMSGSCFITYGIIGYGAVSLASIVFAFLCINPNLKNKNSDSIIYFGHITKKHKDFKEYKKYAQSILEDQDKFCDQITEQIHFLSGLAWKKFVRVTWALRLFIFSLVTMVVIIFSYVLPNLKF